MLAFALTFSTSLHSLDTRAGADLQPPATNHFAFAKTEAQTWRPVERRAHETVWQSVHVISNTASSEVEFHTNSFVEIGGGINVLRADGQYAPADLSFEITEDGAEANAAAHLLSLPANIAVGSVRAVKGVSDDY